MSIYDELKKLEELRSSGLLTEAEFEAQKAAILKGGPPTPGRPGAGGPPMPSTYLAYAILTTLFCCLPFGIVSIAKGSQVSGAYMAGDYALAEKKSREALYWIKLSLGMGVAIGVLYIGVIILMAIMSAQR